MRTSNIPVDRHLLNFSETFGKESIPSGLADKSLSLMVGAGDLEHDGMPNTQKFSQFDVFFCNAWNINGSLQRNVDYINKHYPDQKVICVVDYDVKEQVERFINVFSERFLLIDGHGGHTPHFTLGELRRLLAVGGEAMNIHEKSENVMPLENALFWLENGYSRIKCVNNVYLTARIYDVNSRDMGLTSGQEENLRSRFIARITAVYPNVLSTTISPELLANLQSLTLPYLQEILVGLLYDNDIHLDMKAEIRMNKRVWRPSTTVEIVLLKVPIDFMDTEISLCRDETMKERANTIVGKIKEELSHGLVYPPYAKYSTLLKFVMSDKFEAACLPFGKS